MKKIFFLFFTFVILSCKAQDSSVLTFDSLSVKLIDYLYLKGEIDSVRSEKLKNKEYKFGFVGFFNNTEKGVLKDGIYVFSSLTSNNLVYYVIVENNSFQILDFSKREELENTIKLILDFSERKKYCVDITSDLISSIIKSFYNINKYPINRRDVNCYNGVISTEDLP
jgi:hypothetical protein